MFTEEQTKVINEMIANAVALKSTAEQKTISQEVEQKKTITQEAKESLDTEKQAEIALSKIQESIKFNLSVKDFVEKNKFILPEESIKILATIENKIYKNDTEKANAVRKNLIESFVEKQENIDFLSDSLKIKALNFKALTEIDKERRSGEFWDLVDIGVDLKFNKNKAKELNIAKGIPASGSSGNILQDKILAKAKEKFNQK
jgi:hypothetical protein